VPYGRSFGGAAIANFVSNFIVMATRDSLGGIRLASSHSPSLKTPRDAKVLEISLVETKL